MSKEVTKFLQKYSIYQHAKLGTQNTDLYRPLSILKTIWGDVSMNFVLELPMTKKNHISS